MRFWFCHWFLFSFFSFFPFFPAYLIRLLLKKQKFCPDLPRRQKTIFFSFQLMTWLRRLAMVTGRSKFHRSSPVQFQHFDELRNPKQSPHGDVKERERESTSGRQSARRSWSRFPVNYSRIWFLISFASSRGLIRVEENNSDDYLHTPCRYSRCLSLICG